MDYHSPILATAGAVAAGGIDTGVAAHYGEPVHEQRALESGIAVVDLSHLDVVTVAGADRLSWLNTLSTQLLLDLPAGTSTELLLLDANGRIEHAAKVLEDGERVWLIADSGRGEALAAYLERMKFAFDVVVDRPDVAVLGTNASGPVLSGVDGQPLPRWRDPWPDVGDGGTSYTPADTDYPNEWRAALALAPRPDLAAIVTAALAVGAKLAGTLAWEALRIASWRPRHNREVDDRTIPPELDWLRTAVHLHKGCYRGQETIARVFNIGKPPRRLVFVHIDGSEHVLPVEGDEVIAAEKTIGTLTSVARHHELGPIGLALVRRAADPDEPLTIAGIAASQEVIVNPSGEADGRPAPIDRAALRRPRGGMPDLRRG